MRSTFLMFLQIFIFSIASFAQQKTIVYGTVIDSISGFPLPYANIQIDKTNRGTVTNEDGKFELEIQPGDIFLNASYIGYHKSQINLKTVKGEFEIKIIPSSIELETVTVTANSSKYTWEELFMLNAIEKKNAMLEKLEYYMADAYTKSKFMFKPNPDTTKMIVALIEAISKIGFTMPDLYREQVLGKIMPPHLKNMPYEYFTANRGINLMKEKVKIHVLSLISPLADEALDYYSFRLKQKSLMGTDTTVTLSVSPKTETQMLFKGELIFLQKNHRLLEANLENAYYAVTPTTDSLQLYQKFGVMDDFFNLPIFTKYKIRMDFFGFHMDQVQEYSFANYFINDQANKPNSSFENTISEEPDLTYDIETSREMVFGMPLSEKEVNHNVEVKDKIENAPFYKKALVFFISDIFPLSMNQEAILFGLKISRMSNWYKFNKVQGHFIGGEYQLLNNDESNLYARLGYAFGSKQPEYQVRARYSNLVIDAAREVVNLGNSISNTMFHTIGTLINQTDDYNYYSSNSIGLAYTYNLGSNFSAVPAIKLEKQSPLKAINTNYRANYEISPYRNNGVSLKLRYNENHNASEFSLYGDTYFDINIKYSRNDKGFMNASENMNFLDFSLERYLTISYPFSYFLDFKLHMQSETAYIQGMNFINGSDAFSEDISDLWFYTFDKNQNYVKDYVYVKTDFDLFNITKIDNYNIIFGAMFSYLHPFNNREFPGFQHYKKDFYEYGITLSGFSMLKLLYLINNLSGEINFEVDLRL